LTRPCAPDQGDPLAAWPRHEGPDCAVVRASSCLSATASGRRGRFLGVPGLVGLGARSGLVGKGPGFRGTKCS